MQKKSGWLTVEYAPREESHERTKNKMMVHFITSPYDIPEAFRVVDNTPGMLRVEFRYIDNTESSEEIALKHDVKAFIGKATKRLLAIELKLDNQDVQRFEGEFNTIIEQLSAKNDLKLQADWNYKAVRNALHHGLRKLVGAATDRPPVHAH
jgi:hypothetical protein